MIWKPETRTGHSLHLWSRPQSVYQLYPSPSLKMGSLCFSDPHGRKHGYPLKAGFTEPLPVSRALSLSLPQFQVPRGETWLSWGHVPAPGLMREGWDGGDVLYKAAAACPPLPPTGDDVGQLRRWGGGSGWLVHRLRVLPKTYPTSVYPLRTRR